MTLTTIRQAHNAQHVIELADHDVARSDRGVQNLFGQNKIEDDTAMTPRPET
ncbi:hypothetical protein AB0L63_19140 [Nocardia sp. NPDC051990]|uniref:hypothetical protein n=1 Tax=Nocardia sp. NPDC051990 TaxID=3155285 RepID=UPI003443C040